MEMNEVIGQVRKLEISTKQLVDGLISGNYNSIFKGQGIEFSEIREYRPGDDVRGIDWKVTARFNAPFIKEFIEERDLRVYFAFDVSGSGDFGDLVSKRRKAIELIASLMFSVTRSNDNLGMFLFSDKVERMVPAKKGKRHMIKVLSGVLNHEPVSRLTDLDNSLREISNVLKRRSVVFVVSDFLGEDFSKSLQMLKRRHDVIAINIRDSREHELPDVGLIELEDEETGEQVLVDTSDASFRERYLELVKGSNSSTETMFKKLGIDMITVTTDESYDVLLRKFFRNRKRRGRTC